MHNIQPVYIIFPLLLLAINKLNNKRIKFITTYLLFVFLFVMAKNGPDYSNYQYLYENYGLRSDLHGESLYVLINKIFYSIGVPYWLFRTIFLSSFLFLFVYSLNKISKNFTFSFLFSYLMFIVYFVSAYRQFATISIFIFSIYLMFYNKSLKNDIISLVLNLVSVFIHTLAIYQLAIFVFIFVYRRLFKKEINIDKLWIKQNLLKIICIVVGIRLVLYGFASIPYIQDKFHWIPYFKNLTLIDLGFVSRVIMLTTILYLYLENEEQANNAIFFIYFISMLLYFALPFEMIMGRLINNVRFLECIFIPNLLITFNKNKYTFNYYCNKKMKFIIICIVCITCFAVFTSQMLTQTGYESYVHYFNLI